MSTAPPLPTFIIIGAQKSGTRWLRYNLGKHPDVFTPRRSELSYFNTDVFEKGIGWYRRQFAGWAGQRALGESTPGYMIIRHRPEAVAERIDEQLPAVRLLAILRDPTERAYSAFVHHIHLGRLDPETDLIDYVRSVEPERERFHLVTGGCYAASLGPFVERFRERLLVLLTDEARTNPRSVYRRSLEHIGVDSGFRPRRLADVRFSNPTPSQSKYAARRGRRRPLTEEERAALFPYFAADIERLEELLGRDLSAWRPRG